MKTTVDRHFEEKQAARQQPSRTPRAPLVDVIREIHDDQDIVADTLSSVTCICIINELLEYFLLFAQEYPV